MQLTKWTDYSLRVLMYCAAQQGRSTPVTIAEIERAHGISRSHLTKVVMSLAAHGYLETSRGRGGGLRLLTPAAETSVGEIVRRTETDFTLLECFDPAVNNCRMVGHCRLHSVLHEALARFLASLDGVSLADLMSPAVMRFPLPTP
ncbi:MAG: Rrf2 family transcriptional regulator [Rubrivivax sp.]|nr:Rrf2 family transcriptional regulator [Rubrivivax sp.]